MSAKNDQRFMTFRNALDAEIGVAQLGVAEKGEWLKKKKRLQREKSRSCGNRICIS